MEIERQLLNKSGPINNKLGRADTVNQTHGGKPWFFLDIIGRGGKNVLVFVIPVRFCHDADFSPKFMKLLTFDFLDSKI